MTHPSSSRTIDVNTSRDNSVLRTTPPKHPNHTSGTSRVEAKVEEWTDLFSNACGGGGGNGASPCSAHDLEEIFGRQRTKILRPLLTFGSALFTRSFRSTKSVPNLLWSLDILIMSRQTQEAFSTIWSSYARVFLALCRPDKRGKRNTRKLLSRFENESRDG